MNRTACDISGSNLDTFVSCGKGVYYNREINSVWYIPQGIPFPRTPKTVLKLQDNYAKARINDAYSVISSDQRSAPYQLALTNTNLLDRQFIKRVGALDIFGFLEQGKYNGTPSSNPLDYVSARYINVDVSPGGNITACDLLNLHLDVDGRYCNTSKASLVYSGFVAQNAGNIKLLWRDLTSKTRGCDKDVINDDSNCGTCGHNCGPGTRCSYGQCLSLYCNVIQGDCPVNATSMYRLESPLGGSISKTGFGYAMCCSSPNSTLSTECGTNYLFADAQGHVQIPVNHTFDTSYCMKADNKEVWCTNRPDNCADGETCIGSMSSLKDGRIASCEVFKYKACCILTNTTGGFDMPPDFVWDNLSDSLPPDTCGACPAGTNCSNGVCVTIPASGACGVCAAGTKCMDGACRSLSCIHAAPVCPADYTQLFTYDGSPDGHVSITGGASRVCCQASVGQVTDRCGAVILKGKYPTDTHVQSSTHCL